MPELHKIFKQKGMRIGEYEYTCIQTGKRSKIKNFIFTPQSGNPNKPIISALQKQRNRKLKSHDLAPPDFYLTPVI